MAWHEEQERLLLNARLLVAPPETVFKELKTLAQNIQKDRYLNNTEEVEAGLILRGERYINLAVAMYGSSRAVASALYRHSLEPPTDENDKGYKQGLRLGVLSNEVLDRVHFLTHFPTQIIGREETSRLLSNGDIEELNALLRNPTLDEEIFAAILKRIGIVATIDDGRWQVLVSILCRNERINIEHEHYDSPDLEHMHIHNALFTLLEVAPLNVLWVRTLFDAFDRLKPRQVKSPTRLDHVLERWFQWTDHDNAGNPFEGYYTGLPLKEEFRCLIAALYGRGYENSKTIDFGNPKSNDVALRCAYYGKAAMGKKDVAAALKKDGDVFLFAASMNPYLLRDGREAIEEELMGDLLYRYRRIHDKQQASA